MRPHEQLESSRFRESDRVGLGGKRDCTFGECSAAGGGASCARDLYAAAP
jgi:hypothetical protein